MVTIDRRDFLRLGGLGVAGIAGCLDSDSTDGDGAPGDADIALETVAEGFTSPLDYVDAGQRQFVADQAGRIYVLREGEKEVWLDLRDHIVDVGGYSERGLLGIALHPDFQSNGRMYVRYSAPPQGDYSHLFVLSEFRDDEGTADPESERRLLEIEQPQSNHNSGSIVFGPDDYLYVGVGDGGGANDVGPGHVEDWYEVNEGGNGQDVEENLLGSILRIDVDSGDPYGIPGDNPLVGESGLDEIYAWGFRNPWGMSWDGDRLFVADVGQDLYEEVDVVEAGGNYGWNVREGLHCFDASDPGSPPADCPTETPGGEPLVDPVIEYPQSGGAVSGVAVVGGHVYRGDDVQEIQDNYVFGDWGRGFTADEGSVFAATMDGDQWGVRRLDVAGGLGGYVLGFGQDQEGDLYVLTTESRGVAGESGEVNRLVPP